MTVKEIKEKYRVVTFDRGKTLHLYDKREGSGSRMVYKYLVTVKKVSTGVYIVSESKTRQTSNIDDLVSYIDMKIKTYEFDSEYYDPNYRKGTFEEFVVMDELRKIGFKSEGRETFILDYKNIYGETENVINLSIYGLDSFEEKDEVDVTIHIGEFKWVNGEKIKKEVHTILDEVNRLCAPFLLGNTLNNFEIFEKTKFMNVDDVKIKRLNMVTFKTEEVELKGLLIEKLEKALETLKA